MVTSKLNQRLLNTVLFIISAVITLAGCKKQTTGKQHECPLFPIEVHIDGFDYYKFVNNKGLLAFDDKFDNANIFCDGIAKVSKGRKTYFIDMTGQTVLDYQAKGFSECSDFSEGIAWAMKGMDRSKAFAIDKEGNVLFEVPGIPITLFKDGLAGVKESTHSNAIAYYNNKGELVLPARKDYGGDRYFHQGKISIVSYEKYSSGAYGAINKEGELVVDYLSKIPVRFDENNCAVVQSLKNGLYGLINQGGEYLIEPKFPYLHTDGGLYQFCESLDNPIAGWCNKNGDVVIEPIARLSSRWDLPGGAQMFYGDKWAFVKTDEGNAFIDRKGNIVLKTDFEACSPFINNVALVKDKHSYYGFIDRTGKLVSEDPFIFFIDNEKYIGEKVASDNPMGSLAWY